MVYTYTVIYWLTAMATSLIVHLHTQFSKLMIAVDICSYVAIMLWKGLCRSMIGKVFHSLSNL